MMRINNPAIPASPSSIPTSP